MDHQDEYEFYADPENRQPQGPARRRRTPLTEIVPVRLSSQILAQIKEAAVSDGRSVSSWIRKAIDHELEHSTDPHNEGMESQPTEQPAHAAIAPLLSNNPIVVHPTDILRAQVVLTSQYLIDSIERDFRRVHEAASRGSIQDLFVQRVIVDTDAIEHRMVGWRAHYSATVGRDLEQTQAALARLVRLQDVATTEVARLIVELRSRLKDVQRSVDVVEGEILDAPKAALSDLAEAGLVNFYTFADAARDALARIDEELYQLTKK